MFARILFFLVFVLSTVFGEQHKCKNGYQPSQYIGKVRVPTSCKVETLDCPRSWKSGIPEGGETAEPMVYKMFLTCHEGFTLCGYVPINSSTGEVLGTSGVTIGAGVDLGSKTRASFASLSNSTLLDKLDPYFGLTGDLAACAAIERPLVLTSLEANNVTDVIKDDIVAEVSRTYNADKDAKALPFASIPRGIRTAVVSVWYQFGAPPRIKFPNFWGYVTKNDWNGAVKELRMFYGKNTDKQSRGDLVRRHNEADIVEATLLKCNRAVDVVFLLDESGSVGSVNFQESLDFVKNLIKAFPDDKLRGKNGSRFGLSTFSDNYHPEFYLSSYTTQSGYLSAISRVSYSHGYTYLGAALNQILTDQFTDEHGLRPEVDGLPRILIVLTDGEANDDVSIPAERVRDNNIVVYSMGIGGYNLEQLKEIASSESHVFTLSTFVELEKFVTTITSSACNEPRPASLDKTIRTNVAKDEYQYFSYKVNTSLNLMISVVDLAGNTFVYASRTNPHPYKYDHDWAFDTSQQINKVIVISPNAQVEKAIIKRSTEDEEKLTKKIYVSVTSDTDSSKFTIEGNECNPLDCAEGTNETPKSSARLIIATKSFVVGVAILMIVFET